MMLLWVMLLWVKVNKSVEERLVQHVEDMQYVEDVVQLVQHVG